MKRMRRKAIARLASESDSNAGNMLLIQLIQVDNCKNPVSRFFRTFPLVWWQ